jgi:thymidylate synthase (FAD)
MNVELKFITPDALNFIGECAGICYNSSLERESNIKRAISCKDKGHLATLRFASATFHVSGISRACSHQFVRSKHLEFLQRSQRYCKETEVDFINPINPADGEYVKYVHDHYISCRNLYNHLLQQGVKKEDARFVLPEATTTELIVTGNFQAWIDFIKLRADKHAQFEIRSVAHKINNILAKELDNQLFNWLPDIYEESLERQKMG